MAKHESLDKQQQHRECQHVEFDSEKIGLQRRQILGPQQHDEDADRDGELGQSNQCFCRRLHRLVLSSIIRGGIVGQR